MTEYYKTLYTTTAAAIANSIRHDEISYCEDSPENRDALRAECDEWVDAGEVIEYWTNIEDEYNWRVHILAAESNDDTD